MNKIISIGYTGIKKCYLNLTKKEAIERFIRDLEISMEEYKKSFEYTYEEFEFEDEFRAYDVWEK